MEGKLNLSGLCALVFLLCVPSGALANPEVYDLPINAGWGNAGITGTGRIVAVFGRDSEVYLRIDSGTRLEFNTQQTASKSVLFSPIYFSDFSKLEYSSTTGNLTVVVDRDTGWTDEKIQYMAEQMAEVNVSNAFNSQAFYNAFIMSLLCFFLFDLIYRSILER